MSRERARYIADSGWADYRTWATLTSPDPVPVEHLIKEDTVALPFLKASLKRHLQQFPSSDNGLARTEKHLMEAAAAGHAAPGPDLRLGAGAGRSPLHG